MNTLTELKTASGDLVYGFLNSDFAERFGRAVARSKEVGRSEDGLRRAVKPIMLDNIAFPLTAGR